MKILAVMFLAFALPGSLLAVQSDKAEVIVVSGPTIVAFFPKVSDEDLDKDAGLNEVLSDFQFYAEKAGHRLEKMHIVFQQVYANQFQIRDAKRTLTFRTGKVNVGYYYIAPGKPPKVFRGVMVDDDIVDEARNYFDLRIKK